MDQIQALILNLGLGVTLTACLVYHLHHVTHVVIPRMEDNYRVDFRDARNEYLVNLQEQSAEFLRYLREEQAERTVSMGHLSQKIEELERGIERCFPSGGNNKSA